MRETEGSPTTPTRRSAIGFSLAALVAGLTASTIASSPAVAITATPAIDDEMSLLAACNEFVRLERLRIALFDDIENESARAARHAELDAQQEPLVGLIANLRAKSLEEHRARARAFATMCDGEVFDWLSSGCWNHIMTAALVRDLVALDILPRGEG